MIEILLLGVAVTLAIFLLIQKIENEKKEDFEDREN
jgi:hypothetical protein